VTCALAVVAAPLRAIAGPPFETDDPVPVPCHHIEIDVAQARQGSDIAPSTPTVELDYGPTENVELSIAGQSGELQLGAALRFVRETTTRPQIAFLPSVTFKKDGTPETLLPIWLQKTWGPWTAFGGSGISQDVVFSGVALQHDLRGGSTLGFEVFHAKARSSAGETRTNFNVGYVEQFGEDHALMVALGRSLTKPETGVSFYAGFQIIIAPRRNTSNCRSSD